jgi:hypothetical protein
MQVLLRSQLSPTNAPTRIAHCNTAMDLFNEEFAKLMRPSVKKTRVNLGLLERRIDFLERILRERPFAIDFDNPDQEEESMDIFQIKLIGHLKQMMYVSGETAEPSHETTGMVEEIVRQQVIEMVREYSTSFPHT